MPDIAAICRLGLFAVATVVCLIGTLAVAQEDASPAPPREHSLIEQLSDPKITDSIFKLRILHLTKDELADLAGQWLQATRRTCYRNRAEQKFGKSCISMQSRAISNRDR